MSRRGLGALGRSLLCAVIAACGGDDGSGVDGAQTFSETSDEERVQLCDWYFDEFIAIDGLEFACYSGSLVLSEGDAELCEQLVQDCLDENTEADLDEMLAESVECSFDNLGDTPECAGELTIGAFEDCALGYLDLLEELGGSLSCDDTLEDLATALDYREIPGCAEMVEACPDVPGPFE